MNSLHEPVIRRARTARIRTIAALSIAATALVATAAFAWPTPGAGPAPIPAAPSASPSALAYAHQLYVHCGIRYANFEGRWWQAVHLGEVPMPGQITNYLVGTMTLVDADHATFRSEHPALSADFIPFVGEPPPCQ
ncbi:hypothetical protein Ate02nite_58500 [Paractinoplanes tereljensis]|uniref:Uncharacterized protein n=2 Tax=Paractinoplanes tereljensis TaxID=571912 RepID=A0A919TWB6_9ACTN|nr:hypothetical protein Ate02nite_58500 [Actinoplanes tereljensis]